MLLIATIWQLPANMEMFVSNLSSWFWWVAKTSQKNILFCAVWMCMHKDKACTRTRRDSNNSLKVQGQTCSGEFNCSQRSCAWKDLLCLTLCLPGGWSPGVWSQMFPFMVHLVVMRIWLPAVLLTTYEAGTTQEWQTHKCVIMMKSLGIFPSYSWGLEEAKRRQTMGKFQLLLVVPPGLLWWQLYSQP